MFRCVVVCVLAWHGPKPQTGVFDNLSTITNSFTEQFVNELFIGYPDPLLIRDQARGGGGAGGLGLDGNARSTTVVHPHVSNP